MSREHNQVDTSANTKMDKRPEPGLPIKIPLSIFRWVAYSGCFIFLLIPWVKETSYSWEKAFCGGLILGWFAGLLNAIANKKP